MLPRICHVQVVGPHRLALTFTDGHQGVVDLGPLIRSRGGVFMALQDPEHFARVAVDRDAGTVRWPNGVDLDPDMLYEAARAISVGSEAHGEGH
ncbi:MAG: DUF2442 domain-containing protein [Gemmatimonadetes bacterium]|nr:DUF2442 domain-containing protein [Gemmatimonadota bacterium]